MSKLTVTLEAKVYNIKNIPTKTNTTMVAFGMGVFGANKEKNIDGFFMNCKIFGDEADKFLMEVQDKDYIFVNGWLTPKWQKPNEYEVNVRNFHKTNEPTSQEKTSNPYQPTKQTTTTVVEEKKEELPSFFTVEEEDLPF